MFLLRRLIAQLVIVTLVGWVIRKLIASNDPRAQRIGHGANKLVGGVFGLDESGKRIPRRHRRGMAKSTGSAAVGGLLAYFFDRERGAERRQRAKGFATQRLVRNAGTSGSATEVPSRFDVGAPRSL